MLSKYQSQPPTRMLFRSALACTFVIAPICAAYAGHGTFSNESTDSLDTSTLDPRIQRIAEQEIEDAVTRYKARSGAVVIADPKSGKILAFAESRTDDKSESWKSRVFVPASTIKPFVVAAAIQAGVATEFKKYDCRGPYDVDGTKFTNHDKTFADMTVTEAVAKSGNVCMIKIAQETGSVPMRKTLARFGFDTDTQWRADSRDALKLATIVALGEGVPVTFGTMVRAYSILANKGHLPNHEGAISEATAASVQRTMISAVEQGIARKAAIPGVSVAGKTGTLVDATNVRIEGDVESSRHLGLFAGYAPADNPRFVSFVIIEDGHRPDENHEKAGGGVLAALVVREVVRKSLELGKE
ncbi:MAG: penicillin-binding transpeptidase domain-containing protein [Proteobacteria bacterium]|nr:penicillin-binding transpeptidase domain-containing protein [Pseudomonadota bacterium]